MFDRSLHTGNVAVAFATVASAAADPLTLGVAGALISGALSGTELFKNANRAQKSLAKEMADVMQASIAEADMPEDRRKHVTQMLSIFPPGIEDLARGSMVADTIAKNMRAFVAANARDVAHKGDDELDAYAQVMRETLAPFLTPDTLIEGMLAELLARTEKSGDAARMRDAGISEEAIIALARTASGSVETLEQAWRELENLVPIAVRVQQEGQVPSNHGSFVDEVLKRVTELSADGEYSQAGDEIAEALAKVEAEKSRLLRSGIEMAMLAGDSTRAAELLVQQAEADGQAGFNDLRALWIVYYERGRDKGVALDLRIAIDLAKIVQTRAANSGERGAALNDLGNALAALGARDSSAARLEQAVVAYKAALQEWTQDKVPLDWAMTQNNLGNALRCLGERNSNPARLQQAVLAYKAALEEWTQDTVPRDWAMTQNNLGNALATLGARDSDPARLDQAVTAYRAALQEWTQDKVPLNWAKTQNNLGNALQTLGARESNPARLEQAVAAYEAALEERTREKVPFDWAVTRHCQAGLLRAFFDVTGERAYLDRAMEHARAAREVYEELAADHYVNWIDSEIAKIGARRAG